MSMNWRLCVIGMEILEFVASAGNFCKAICCGEI